MTDGLENTLELKKNNSSLDSLQTGYLVFIPGETEDKGELLFLDSGRNSYQLRNVLFVGPEFNTENGYKNMPKPYIIDDKGNVKEFGDRLLYTYLDSNNKDIVVLGTGYSLSLDNFDSLLNYDLTDLKNLSQRNLVRNNKKRYLAVSDDAEGNITIFLQGKGEEGKGNIGIKVSGTDENGNVKLEMSGKFVLNQTQKDGDAETVIAQILMDNTKDAEKIKIIDKNKNQLVMDKAGIKVTDKTQNIIEMNESGVKVTAKGNCEITADDECTITAAKAQITGGELTVDGSVTPTGSGPWNAIPSCIFSSAPHCGNKVSGT
jgi:hypothetical protein